MSKRSLNLIMTMFTLLFAAFAPQWVVAEELLLPDPSLEAAVRNELNLFNKPSLEEADLLKLTSLYPRETDQKIKSIEGLQHATNLQSLIAPGNDFQNLEPIQSLTKLNFLVLTGNHISNIEPLRNLTSLKRLLLSSNQIEDIQPLAGLSGLTDLLMSSNQIRDITALETLPLRWLDLTANQIEDISPLSRIPSLETLYVGQNPISRIDALLDLPRLKEVHLEGNPLDDNAAAVIQALTAKGVKVQTVQTEVPPKNTEIRVNLDANAVAFDVPPFIKDGTTMVQFRPVFERLGVQMTWDEATRTITGEKDGVHVQLQIDNPVAAVNGNKVTLPAAPMIVDGSTFVPVRFISESVGAKVDWSEKTRTVIVQSKNLFNSKDGKFHLTAYGLWRDLNTDIEKSELEETESQGAQLAIRYFNYTKLFIYADAKASNNLKAMSLASYLASIKQDKEQGKEDIIEEKQTKVLGRDALQLTYVNHNDWDSRIDTLLVFETDSYFYTLVDSSYKDTYKGSLPQFQEILESMSFNE